MLRSPSHQNSLHLFIILPLFFVEFHSLSEAGGTDYFSDCTPFDHHCGNQIYRISYPFLLNNSISNACGHPGFNVSCDKDNTGLLATIRGKDYRINSIDYKNHEINITDASFVDGPSSSTCSSHSFTNSTIDSLLFNDSKNPNLTVYLNCSPKWDPVPQDLYDISCLSTDGESGNKSYYSFPIFPVPPGAWSACSSVVFVPLNETAVEDLARFGSGRLFPSLKEGFELSWKVGGVWCDECEASNGVCGYNRSAPGAKTCYCPNTSSVDDGVCRPTPSGTGKGSARKLIGIGAGVVGALLVGCISLIIFKRRKRLQQQSGSSNLLSRSISSKISSKNDPELGASNYHTHIFSYDELEEATNGFNTSGELGDGGFGTVYKGKLRDGRTVAVKRLYEHNYRRLEQFMNEVEILSRLRHQHLVTLYGCTSRHSRELLLVYEYIPNGTVADHLHGPKCTLPWPVRMSISIETADALAYLHAVEPQIIHRDVKTSNILLDNNYHVKVADFGLSRLFPLDATHVSTAPQGTPGYVDPEYHQCYQLTDKSDVYSFGVVLVELISSKPAVDISRHRNEINLANLAVTKIQNSKIHELVDPELRYDEDLEVKRMIEQVAEVAFRCLQLDSEMRPSIREVLEMLRGIEGGGYKVEKEGDRNEAQMKEESRLLKNVLPFSPDTVAERWQSRSTTPSTST